MLTLALLLGVATCFSSCSSGTKDGDTNVETGRYKDTDATEHNAKGAAQPSTDTTGNMAAPYDKAEKSVDRDVDRQADPVGTREGQ